MVSSHEVPSTKMRVGVCGTGYWAELVHLPTLAAMPGIALAGVFGRTAARAQELATRFSIPAFDDFDDMLLEVDAISFVVPPSVQAALALRAAEAGKHLILEKPIATSLADADRLAAAVERRGLVSVIFLTRLFADDVTLMIDQARSEQPTTGDGRFASAALLPGSPYAGSAWRLAENGTLWDAGPHVLSVLTAVFGPVVHVRAETRPEGSAVCDLEHLSGAQSSMSLNLRQGTVGGLDEHYVFSGGRRTVEARFSGYDRQACFRGAVQALLTRICGGASASPDVHFGRDLVAVLQSACDSAGNGGKRVRVLDKG